MSAKRQLIDVAILMIVAAALARWLGRGFGDWRAILGTILSGAVVLMMQWNQEIGIAKAKRLSEEILAKHNAEVGVRQ